MKTGFRNCIMLSLMAFGAIQAQWKSTQEMSGNDIGEIWALAVRGDQLFAGTYWQGVFRTSDGGASWVHADSGLKNKTIYSLAVKGPYLFAGTYSGLFRSSDNGSTWTETDSALQDHRVLCMAVNDSFLFTGGGFGGGVERSPDNGQTWIQLTSQLQPWYVVHSLIAIGDTLVVGGSVGTNNAAGYRSTDNGLSWAKVEALGADPQDIVAKGPYLFAGFDGYGVYRSSDNGVTWKDSYRGMPGTPSVYSFAVAGNDIFAGSPADGVYRSGDNGDSWTPVNDGWKPYNLYSLAVAGGYLYAGTVGGVRKRPLSEMTSAVPHGRPDSKSGFQEPFPKIIRAGAKVGFTTARRDRVRISVYDTKGIKVAELMNAMLEPGSHSVTLEGSGLAAGILFLRIGTEGVQETHPFLFGR